VLATSQIALEALGVPERPHLLNEIAELRAASYKYLRALQSNNPIGSASVATAAVLYKSDGAIVRA
jgi:hypothetical protein